MNYPSFWDKYKCSGDGWLASFQSRHPEIILRTPEPTSVGRAWGFNRTQLTRFYNLLDAQIQKYNVGPDALCNMDETRVMTTTNKPLKILSISGKIQVGIISCGKRAINYNNMLL